MASKGIRVLVTGFGAFQNITQNPSWEIVSRLSDGVDGIEIIAHPEPLRAAYHSLAEIVPKLVAEHHPDIILNIGLATDYTYYAIEKSALRDGYHQVPDMDRKVVTKAEGKTIWGKKSAERLESSFNLDRVLELWSQKQTKAKKGNKKQASERSADVDMRVSDDVGNYVCGLIYYASLAELSKRSETSKYAVFLHVPPLTANIAIEKGVPVVMDLIRALAIAWEERSD